MCQRRAAGMYDRSAWSAGERETLYADWCKRGKAY